MSDRIKLPYKFSLDEKKLIERTFHSYTDWNKKTFDSIKKNIICHLRNQQNNKCCYCKKILGFDIREVEIDHILSKKKFQNYTFYNTNLALSCPACNTKKSSKSVIKSDCKDLNSSKNYIIVHAHFDNYSEHIEIRDECVFIALSEKGANTIKICELYRLYNIERLSERVTVKQSNSKIKEMLFCLRTAEPMVASEYKEELLSLLFNK